PPRSFTSPAKRWSSALRLNADRWREGLPAAYATNYLIAAELGRARSRHTEMGSPIFLPAGLVLLRAEGSFFSVADGLNAVNCHSLRHQKILGGVRAAIAQGHVVFSGAALVAVSLDHDGDARIRTQESSRGGKCGTSVVSNAGFIVVKERISHFFGEKLFE